MPGNSQNKLIVCQTIYYFKLSCRWKTGQSKCFPQALARLFYSIKLHVLNLLFVNLCDTTFVFFRALSKRFERMADEIEAPPVGAVEEPLDLIRWACWLASIGEKTIFFYF